MRIKKRALVEILTGLLLSPLLWAETGDYEFDQSFLRGNETLAINVERFRHKNTFAAGRYEAEIYVNRDKKGSAEIEFIEQGDDVVLCLSEPLKQLFDLKSQAYQAQSGECVDAKKAIPEGEIRFDVADLQLHLTIAQALTEPRPRGYVPPALWQDGVPALRLNYHLNHYQTFIPDSGRTVTTYLNLRAGASAYGWYLSHIGAKNWQKTSAFTDNSERYQSIETNLRRPIGAIGAELAIGDIGTSGELLESVSLRGVSLSSDDRMLPSSQRGYAPIIQGVAHSNANVSVRQNGYVIYQMSVPAGPFVISDLYPSGYGGDLTVEIQESSGETRSFTVPFATLVELVRPQQWKYQLAYGRYRSGQYLYPQKVVQGSLQYGLYNNISLNTAAATTENYHAYLLGVGLNTPIGAFVVDNTWSKARFEYANRTHRGYSLRASYSVRLPTDTYITLATYRYSSREYYTLAETLAANHNYTDDRVLQSRLYLRPKSQYQISLNQDFGEKGGRLYLAGSTYTYWNSKRKQHQYQFSYGNSFKRLNYQIGYSQTKSTEQQQNNAWYLNLSLPLGERHQISTTYNRSKQYQLIQADLSGTFDDEGNIGYGIGASRDNNRYQNLSGNFYYSSAYANFSGNASHDNLKHKQLSMSLSGAVVAHPYGVSLSNNVGDTFAIVHAKDAQGAKINGLNNQQIDYFGNGIMPYLSPYERNSVSIDPEEIALSVDFAATQQEVIPKAYSAMLVKFDTFSNSMVLFELSSPQPIPLGSEAFDERGKLVGYVVQGNQLFASKLSELKGKITVRWDSGANNQCQFDYQIPDLTNLEMKSYPVQCVGTF